MDSCVPVSVASKLSGVVDQSNESAPARIGSERLRRFSKIKKHPCYWVDWIHRTDKKPSKW
jgi:hypothetical protein